MTEIGRTRNRRGEGGRLRGEIVNAALHFIDEHGDPAALSLRAVARTAGISAPAIYDHFTGLDAVREAALEECFAALRATVVSAVADAGDPVAALTSAASAYLGFARQYPARYRLMFAADGCADNAVETFRVVERTIAACVSAGLSTSADPRVDAWMVWAALHGVATLDKPSRTEMLKLGTLDRPNMLRAMVLRLAGIAGDEEVRPNGLELLTF